MYINALMFSTVIIGILPSISRQYAYNLYYTDRIADDLSHDCLYFLDEQISNIEDVKVNIEQTIEFCFRSLSKMNGIVNSDGISSILTFDEMRREGITAENLIQWSASIDLIERYENYLQTNQSSSDDEFYQCFEPWFGPFCQYSFDINETFIDIVRIQFAWKPVITNNAKFTCYEHLKCKRFFPLSCFDWREICDGKWDCIDGEDEENCLELEINQCNENEYQCRNGICIDKAFLLDDTLDITSPECFDGSDEGLAIFKNGCERLVTFRCEDIAYRYPRQFSCGDGLYFPSVLPRKEYQCRNKRDVDFNYVTNWNRENDTRFPHCFKIYVCGVNVLTSIEFDQLCKRFCQNRKECANQTLKFCPSAIIAPNFPIWDGHVRLGYFTNQTTYVNLNSRPHFVCYDIARCPFLIPDFMIDNYTCIYFQRLNLTNSEGFITKFLSCHHRYQSANETHCLYPNMLRCLGTNKCIPYRRIMDGIWDCYDGFDESNASNSCATKEKFRFECTSEKKCLSPMLVDNSENNCIDGADEHFSTDIVVNIRKLLFSSICDGWTDMTISNNETDETNCEEWPCSNQYTRCNGVWNCRKGEDELNCSSEFQCPPDHHPCLLPHKLRMDCLHMNFIEDGIVHCLGSTDERWYCRLKNKDSYSYARCWNDTDCQLATDMCSTCNYLDNIAQLCKQAVEMDEKAADIVDYLQSTVGESSIFKRPFSHKSSRSFPSEYIQLPIDNDDEHEETDISEDLMYEYEPTNDDEVWLCNRGILIRVGNEETPECLCPQNYYGNRCRYQNQRVSLTLRLRKENFQRLDIIGVVIRLVDHTDVIHSFDQITFIPTLDCDTKFNLYLLYQTQPKDMTKNYTIEIDAFDKTNLMYLTSWILPIPFLFLPVNRLSAELIIPTQSNRSNYPSLLMDKKSNCSSDSILVGFANNRLICLCPLNKTGPRCLIRSICRNETCQNGGICVPYDTRISLMSFVCVCPEGYSGRRCEKRQVSISISFSSIKISDSLRLHYITVNDDYLARKSIKLPRATIFKKIPYNQNTIQIYIPFPFHLLYAQILDSYYLILLQHNYTSSANFSVQISMSNYCPHIRELVDQQTLEYPILRRVKSYHILCKKNSHLLCFHDEDVFMCLCTDERHANCFHFDFTMTYDCQGKKYCENNGTCYQDHQHCPTTRICICPMCFYGSKCQFQAKHLGITLDSIIGYHIYPGVSFSKQSKSIYVSMSVTIIMLVIVFITGNLSIWTFKLKTCRETGCGIYLYTSSIISIVTILILNLKLSFLIVAQIIINISRSFLLFNCFTMDFLLRLLLAMIDWLHAAVAIERFLIVFLGVKFNKKKSKQTAKRVIVIISIVVTLSLIHDPIHRRLFDDTEEKRIWCLTSYTFSIEIYNSFINILHFIAPFSINLLSAIGIIVLTARQRLQKQKEESRWTLIKKQFSHHKHLLVSSILLVILALPRLIISFLPNCMTSTREYKLFLAGYFISFIPPLLPFFTFVLTSKKYKKECYIETKRKWAEFKRRLNLL